MTRFDFENVKREEARNAARGFTLVELMISIALVLVLILGVNFVFKTTTDAVGSGQTINGFTRDSQASQTVLFDDFKNVAKPGPCFIIASQRVTQFLNTADSATGTDPSLIQVDNAGGTPQSVNPVYCDYRSHRVDLVRFFAHGFYPRRSANDGSFSSSTTATDAFITLGHAALPRYDQSAFYGPVTDGPGGNSAALARVGSYASDWVLARSVILLKDPNTNLTTGGLANNEANYPRYPNPQNNSIPGNISGDYTSNVNINGTMTPFVNNLTPLSFNSPDNLGAFMIQQSRYDLANVTMEQFRRYLADSVTIHNYLNNTAIYPADYSSATPNPPPPKYYLWWNPLVYDPNVSLPFFFTPVPATALPYQFGILAPAFQAQAPSLARSQANPLIPAPLTSAAVAQMAPYFLQHCSQFVVEYAGDYLQQDGLTSSTPGTLTGQITGLGSDGQVDYVIVTDPVTGNRTKKIRWYGMPRNGFSGNPSNFNAMGDTTNYPTAAANIVVRGYNPGQDASTYQFTDPYTYAGVHTHNIMEEFVDVIPLRDYYTMYLNTITPGSGYASPTWEVDNNFDPSKDYGNPTANANGLNHVYGSDARYACAWYNDMPAMVRILVKVDDPNNKVKDGPWYEYVFKLK